MSVQAMRKVDCNMLTHKNDDTEGHTSQKCRTQFSKLVHDITNLHEGKWGYPFSKEAAENRFTALGDNWWKQIYDGKYHPFGKMVFDQGLHKIGNNSAKEPGFYASALKAFHLAKENLGNKVTVDFYLDLHKLACDHFNGEKNNTGMLSQEAGAFRNISEISPQTAFSVSDILAVILDKNSLNFSKKAQAIRDFRMLRVYHGDELSYVSILDEFKEAGKNLSIFFKFESLLSSNFESLEKYIEQLEVNPLLKNTLPKIKLERQNLYIYYKIDAHSRSLSKTRMVSSIPRWARKNGSYFAFKVAL